MRNIGIDVKKVEPKEGDQKDPFTSPVSLRGQQIVGTVVSAKRQRTATILIERQIKLRKYNRYIRQRSKIHVHNPDSINAQEGDVVKVVTTRPLSKTKHHVIVEIVKKAGESASAEVGNVAVDVTDYKEAQAGQRKATKKKASAKKESEKEASSDKE
ncbi:MAG: 30S ribosomal protein S17 [Nanoarchaeota archaeon]